MSAYGPTEPMPGKGDTLCNRTACQRPMSQRWWNRITEAWYCPSCARRINAGSTALEGGPLCSQEIKP